MMQERTVKQVKKLARKHAGKNVLLVVHAGVIRGLICHFLRLPYRPNLKRGISHRYIGVFEFDGTLCQKYNEIGSLSSMVKDGVVSIPWKKKTSHRQERRGK